MRVCSVTEENTDIVERLEEEWIERRAATVVEAGDGKGLLE